MFKKKPYIIGVDIGGSKILLQRFDKKLRLIDEEEIKTQTRKGEKGFLEQLEDLIEKHMTKSVKILGIALPGIVNQQKGVLIKAPNLPTKKDLKIRSRLEKKFGVKVFVDNDINAFLAAEMTRPALQKYQNVVAVMSGTGVGGAILIEGQIYRGASGYAGEVGHMIIENSAKEKTMEERDNDLEDFGIGLANINLIFNPQALILGGGNYHHNFKKQKKKLEKIIAGKALDKKAPKIVDGSVKPSVALGMAIICSGNLPK